MEKPAWFDLKNYQYLNQADLEIWGTVIAMRIFRENNYPENGRLANNTPPVSLIDFFYFTDLDISQHPVTKSGIDSSHLVQSFRRYDLTLLQKCIDELNEYTTANAGLALKNTDTENLLALGQRTFDIDQFLADKGSILCSLSLLSETIFKHEDDNLRPLSEIDSPTMEFIARVQTWNEIKQHVQSWEPCDTSAQEIFEKHLEKIVSHLQENATWEDEHICGDTFFLDNPTYLKQISSLYLTPLNFSPSNTWAEELNAALTPQSSLLKVNLDTPDEALIESFKAWIAKKREEHPLALKRRGNSPSVKISDSMIRSWLQNQLIPLWDLLYFRHYVELFSPGKKITNEILAEWLNLSTYDQPGREVSKRIGRLKTLKELLPSIKAQGLSYVP